MFVNLHKFPVNKVATKTTLILISIILLGAFLRLYNFSDLLRFNADQVRDAQIIDQIRAGEFPLLGPKAGGTKFNLGPAFYYLEYLSGAIFGFTPNGIAFFIPLLSTFSIYLFYLLFKKIFTTNTALLLTLLYAISFYAVKYSHFAWNPNVIPFFIFAFLLLLNKIVFSYKETRQPLIPRYYDFIFLGIIIGIGIQLHATLLVLMPLFTVLVFIYLLFKKEKVALKKIILLISIIVFLNIPFIYEAIINNGKNIQDFVAGTQTKTKNDSNIINNTLYTIQFFLQGSAYHLYGIEPQKNWLNIIKLLKSRNITEITLLLTSLMIFLSSSYLILKKIYLTKNKEALYLILSFSALSFLFLIPLGTELNLRFFIMLQFLPYLLIGLIIQALINLKKNKILTIATMATFIVSLIFLNLSSYQRTYNLDNYTAPESNYGGISLGELNSLCSALKAIQKENNLKEVYIENFEFKRSLEYICDKKYSTPLNFLSEKQIIERSMFFSIVEDKNSSKNIDKYQKDFNLIKNSNVKRFNLLFFEKINAD